MTPIERPTRSNVTPDLRALFDAIISMDEHKEIISISEHAGRYTHNIQALIEAYEDSFDSYQLERAEFFRENERVFNHFATYNAPTVKRKTIKQHRYPEPTSVDLAMVRACYLENELGDAALFSNVFAGQVCYDHTAKKWYLWSGHFWQRDTTGHITILIAGKLGSVYLKAGADLNTEIATLDQKVKPLLADMANNDQVLKGLQEKYKQTQVEIKQFQARARDLRGAKRMTSVAKFIQSLMGVTSGQWDTDPWLIGTADGVVDLHDGTFRDGDPDDHIRTIIPTAWTGLNTPCPRFEQFQQEIFDDNEDKEAVIAFKQRLLGYGITGLTSDAIFPILFGEEGRNGKDTELGTYKDVLGPLVGAVSNDVFVSNDKYKAGGAATPHICDLQGKRLVWGSETKQSDKLNIAQLKLLTGGGDVSARQNYGEQYSFSPTHKLLLMTNYKPHADAKDKAFWARACLIEYKTRFVSDPKAPNERKADPFLKETLRQEASGILAWLVRGCLAWQREGLDIPKSIQLATRRYRDEEDSALQFVEDCCIKEPGAKAKGAPLYNAYKIWSKDQGFFAMDNKQFSSAMGKLEGIKKGRGGRGVEYSGVKLIPPDEDGSLWPGEKTPGKESAR